MRPPRLRRLSWKKDKQRKSDQMTDEKSLITLAGYNDDGGEQVATQGLHQSLPTLGSTPHSHMRQDRPGGSLRRRCSEPAVNVRRTYSPTGTNRSRRKQQPPSNQAPHEPAVAGRDIYERSLSSTSLQHSSHHNLDDSLHQVRWAADAPSSSNTNQQTAWPTGVSAAESFFLSSSVSMTSSTSENLHARNHKTLHHAAHNNNNSNNTASTRPSTPPNESMDGFGPIVKSPKGKKLVMGTATTRMGVAKTSRRRNRNVEPSQRISQCDFLPIDPSFGDFANLSPASFHNSLPTTSSGFVVDGEDVHDHLVVETMKVVRPKTPRLWDSMSHIEHNNNNNKEQQEERITSKIAEEKKNDDNMLHSSSHSKKKVKHKSMISPKASPHGKKKYIRRQSVPTIPSIQQETREEALNRDTAFVSPTVVKRVHKPALDMATDHSPTFTAATAPTVITATSATSATRRSTSSTIPSKDDLFLIEMHNFRAKSASKMDVKERNKLKKTKKKKKRLSLPGEPTVEFNVEDQSDNFDDLENYEEDMSRLLDSSEHLHYSQQPLEIVWDPPAFAALEGPEEGRMVRRNSMPTSMEDYEPITPSFSYDKARSRRRNRKSSKVHDAVPAFIMSPPFGMQSDDDGDLNQTVNAILNQGAENMGGFRDRGHLVSTEEALGMSESKTKMSSTNRSKKARRPSTGQNSTRSSSRKGGVSSRLNKSSKAPSEPQVAHGQKSRHRGSKARRRGSTSVIEMSSSSVRHRENGKSKRREGSMPPSSSRSSSNNNKVRSRSRPKSPSPRVRLDKTMDASATTTTTRSRTKNSSGRRSRRESDPEAASTSSTRRDKLVESKKPSATRRRATSASPSPKLRKDSRSRHHSAKQTSSGDRSAKRSGDKSGNKKSSSKRRSSLPPGGPRKSADPGREKSRTKSRRQTTDSHHAMHRSQPIVSKLTSPKKKKKPRSKSIEHNRQTDDLHVTKSTKKKSKSPKPKSKRRASLSSMQSGSTLEAHIVAPAQPPSGQSSWSALTLSTAHSNEHGYTNSQKPALPQLQRNSSWSSDFDLK